MALLVDERVNVATPLTHVERLFLRGEEFDPLCVCVCACACSWQVDRVESRPTRSFTSLELQARATAASGERIRARAHTHARRV